MRIYVGGAWVERHGRVKPIIASLQEAGHTITHDWTKEDTNSWSNALHSDSDMPKEERFARARKDCEGILEAQWVWILAPHDRGAAGLWAEFGIAVGLRKPVMVSGANCRRTIFTELAQALYEKDEDAIEFWRIGTPRESSGVALNTLYAPLLEKMSADAKLLVVK